MQSQAFEQPDRSDHQSDCTSYYVESNKGRPGHGRCKTVQYTWIPVWNLCITVYVIVFVCIMRARIYRPVDHKEKALKDALPMGPFIWLGFHVAVLLTLI